MAIVEGRARGVPSVSSSEERGGGERGRYYFVPSFSSSYK